MPSIQLPRPARRSRAATSWRPRPRTWRRASPIDELGAEVDPASLAPGLVPLPNDDGDGRIVGEVLWVDRYGNCQLNIAPEQLGRGRGVGTR